jgi:tRNA-modifying protein YgfZ
MTNIAQLTDRAVLRIAGEEARPFLQGLLTNDVDKLTPDAPLWGGLLSAQGKYMFDMILFDAGDSILADTYAPRAAELAKRLNMYKLRRAVRVEPTDLKVFAAWGGECAAPYDPRLPGLGRRWVADNAETNQSVEDYDSHRHYLGVPDSSDYEVDKLMWLETNAAELNGVSFTKGCYVGQENTVRMHHRDRLRKRLLPVLLSELPGEDRVIRASDREAGELRTWRAAPNAGPDAPAARGIAHLRLEHVEAKAALTLGGAPVLVEWPTWLGGSSGSPL